MKPINYQLTNTILNNLIKLETQKTVITAYQLEEHSKKELIKLQMKNSIFHIAHILGISVTLNDTEKFLIGSIDSMQDPKYRLLNNVKNTIDFIRSTKDDTFLNLNPKLILHLNKLLTQFWKESWEATLRNSIDIDPSFDSWIRLADESISTAEIENEIINTFDWFQNNSSDINPIIKIAAVIYKLIRIAPFSSLNKITITTIADLLLQKEGYMDNTYLSTIKLFDQNESSYFDLWEKATKSPTGNITYWIETFIDSIAREFEDMKTLIQQITETQDGPAHKPFLDLNKRQLKILKYLQSIPSLKREDYVQMFDVSTMTAFRDLDDLRKKKLLKIEGKGRATKYVLANR